MLEQTIAIHAGRRLVRRPGECIERELRDRVGQDWIRTIPTGAVLAIATLAGMAWLEYVDLTSSHVAHKVDTEMGFGNDTCEHAPGQSVAVGFIPLS